MTTLILILAISVIVFLLVKKYKKTTTLVPTTTTIPTTTPTPKPDAISYFWYILYRCDDANIYYVGPFTGEQEFSIGAKVEGATDVFYNVIGTRNSAPDSVISGITNTGVFGC